VTVEGGSGYWGRYNSPFYLRGDREDIGDYHKKGCERGVVEVLNLAYLPVI
jgi:hypothetical protein